MNSPLAKKERSPYKIYPFLPFNVGERIDVIIIPHSSRQPEEERYPFWGKPITYVNPTDPVAEEDIVALAGAWADMPLAEELRQDLGQDAPREQC